MEIKDLKAKMGKADVTVTVVEVGDAREFAKFGKQGRVANATVEDASGKVTLTLWNEQVDLVKPGDKIQIKNGYVNEWQGELQLTTGKFGTLEKIGEGPSAESKTPQKETASVKKEFKKPAKAENKTDDEELDLEPDSDALEELDF